MIFMMMSGIKFTVYLMTQPEIKARLEEFIKDLIREGANPSLVSAVTLQVIFSFYHEVLTPEDYDMFVKTLPFYASTRTESNYIH